MLLRFEKYKLNQTTQCSHLLWDHLDCFRHEVAIQLAENFARVPETVSGSINSELNTRFYEKMERSKIKIDPFTEVPLPDYLATDDCISVRDVEPKRA